MGLSPRRNSAELAPSILFPSRLERCPILAGKDTCLEYRSVKICGKRYPALVDNQASLNMMSLAFVKKIGLVLHPDSTAFRLTDGSICHAVGRVRTRCKLVRPSQAGSKPITHQQFYVLQHTFTPLVLGVPFLSATGLPGLFPPGISSQTISSEELAETQSTHCSTYRTLCLKVLLTHKSLAYGAIAIPDNGSNINLISLDYARAIGFVPNRASEAGLPLTLGNGQTVFALGKIYTTIQLQHNTPLSSRIPITFFAIKGLVADLVLSRHFSKKNLLFEECQPHLQWILIEREIPGFLPSGSGIRSKTFNDQKAAKIPISPDQSKMNNNPGRFEKPGYFQAILSAPQSSSHNSNHASAQVQHRHSHMSVAPSNIEEPKAAGTDTEDHLAADIPVSKRTDGAPVVPISSNSGERSHNSSQRARPSPSPGTTSSSDTPSEEKYSFSFTSIFKQISFRKQGKVHLSSAAQPARLSKEGRK